MDVEAELVVLGVLEVEVLQVVVVLVLLLVVEVEVDAAPAPPGAAEARAGPHPSIPAAVLMPPLEAEVEAPAPRVPGAPKVAASSQPPRRSPTLRQLYP